MNIFAALGKHARCADARADGRADSGAYSASGDRADDCPDARCGADLLDILFGRIAPWLSISTASPS